MTRMELDIAGTTAEGPAPAAVVIGAGLGGLAAAMRLGAKGYRVTVIDRLDCPGGRGSALWQGGQPRLQVRLHLDQRLVL